MIIMIPFLLCFVFVDGRSLYRNKQNPNIVYGDIVLPQHISSNRLLSDDFQVSMFIKEEIRRWSNNVVPYAISKLYSKSEAQNIVNALKELEEKSCFKFVKKTDKHKDYIEYKSVAGCSSMLGRQGGKQRISLEGTCVQDRATIQHETLHSLGMHHEHQRPDRDKHINIIYKNIESTEKRSFDKVDMEFYQYFEYDLDSIMHYDGHAFGKINKNGDELVTIRNKKTNKAVPENTKISKGDIKKLLALGNCSKSNSTKRKSPKGAPAKKSPKKH